jgi:hypothetical protein
MRITRLIPVLVVLWGVGVQGCSGTNGGSKGAGGSVGAGGTVVDGGQPGTGGSASVGAGGKVGGSIGSGGSARGGRGGSGNDGGPGTGGAVGSGGNKPDAASGTGGGSGGSRPDAASAGGSGANKLDAVSGTGGAFASDAGAGNCKRGIAANTAPAAAFFPGVSWWYNWSNQGTSKTGIEFVPMLWGSAGLTSALPAGSAFLLTFNEPNFKAQSNLTAAQAASNWPAIQSKAAGIPIVGPGMNYCGPANQCNGTDPYQYLTDFFGACAGCQVDYVAVHWYNCDLPSLKDYLETGANLPGFEQFGKPIWLTEFSCDTTASAADQEAYMRAAIPYLEGNPKVFRYSWFSADPIPKAKLLNADGSPTALGQVYIGLPQGCQL